MLTRRALLTYSALCGALVVAGQPAAWAQGAQGGAVSAADATRFVDQLGKELVAIIDGPGSYEEKKRRLGPIVEQSTDVDGIARFCLGRFWRTATPAQQAEYTKLFHDVLLNNIFGKIGEFQGVTFTMTNTVQREGDILVGTLIKRPNQQANTVQWVVNPVGGQPKIADIVAEGTSLRLTQRSDYASYLQRNGNSIDALLAAMRKQIAR